MKHFLAEKIRKKLDEKQLSVQGLEKKAGLKINSIRNILTGHSLKPNIDIIISIANALDCSVSDLIEGDRKELPSLSNNAQVEFPELLAEALHHMLKVTHAKNCTLTLQQTLVILGEVYSYAIKTSPPKVDDTFIEWFIERTIN